MPAIVKKKTRSHVKSTAKQTAAGKKRFCNYTKQHHAQQHQIHGSTPGTSNMRPCTSSTINSRSQHIQVHASRNTLTSCLFRLCLHVENLVQASATGSLPTLKKHNPKSHCNTTSGIIEANPCQVKHAPHSTHFFFTAQAKKLKLCRKRPTGL